MDASRFDLLARVLGSVRTRRSAATLVGAAVVAPLTTPDHVAGKHKKHKKKCAKKCTNGCCTSKYGKCIQPAQQDASRCGAGGQTCHGGCPACTTVRPCPAGKCCKGDGTCGACLVFATSTPLNGHLQGLTGADAICQSLAGNAGLPGTYMAWLSTATTSPSTRFTRATAPYTLVDGTVVAANWNALTSGGLGHAIDMSELGTSANSFPDQVWTNTLENGEPGGPDGSGAHCSEWSTASDVPNGNTGFVSASDAGWTNYSYWDCDSLRRIYCFQQR
jgi:hypothetical protein